MKISNGMKEYDHKKIEPKWQTVWDKKKIYKTPDNSKKKKFYILDMFPYVSGEGIHVGHPKGYIATDVVSRMKRMQGFNVLHPMGFDSFGLPAENYAIKTKTNPIVSVVKNINRFKKQLEIIGFDYDWSREVNTSDPKYYKWTQWIFLKLLEHGLAYESNEPVNWCPKDKTILANEDVEDGKCERCGTLVEKRPIRQWVLKITDYADRLLSDLDELDWPESIKESQRNWIGRSEGMIFSAKVKDTDITIQTFSAHFEGCYADTFFVIAPDHPLLPKLLEGMKDKDKVLKKATDIVKERNKFTEGEYREIDGIFTGRYAIDPLGNGDLPIWVGSFALANYGTGIVKCSAHDERDFAFAKKYNIKLKEVIEPLFINTDGADAFRKDKSSIERDVIVCVVKHWSEDKYLCSNREKLSWKGFITGGIENNEKLGDTVLREIQEETGYKNIRFVKSLPKIHSKFYQSAKKENRFAHFHPVYVELIDGERDEIAEAEKDLHEVVWIPKDEVESFIDRGDMKWIWRSSQEIEKPILNGILTEPIEFKGREIHEARKDIANWLVKKGFAVKKTTYKLHDWVFSRQRYWGEPIPVLRDGNKVIPVKERDLPVKLPKVKFYEPTGTAESPLANVKNWINVKVGKKILKRESNTMPQWAGSSWYYLRYMDPKNSKAAVDKKKEKYWNMVDLYVGGAEHATRHLIYARFWHKFLYDIGVVADKEPFKRLQHVGLIIASDGRKMSKRFGNIINPDEIISTFGADTLRLYEMFMGPFDQAVSWNTDSLIGPRRFLERVWKICLRWDKNSKRRGFPVLLSPRAKAQEFLVTTQSSPTKLLHKTIKKVSEDIESMHFNTAVSTLMIFVNEMEKSEVSREDYKKFLQILAPFAPHITEELWSMLGEKKSINLSDWPSYDENLIKDLEIKIVIQINGKVRAEMLIQTGGSEEDIKKKALTNQTTLKFTAGKEIKKIIYVKNRLVNIVV
jgi:leucyl-tRNA synthetase